MPTVVPMPPAAVHLESETEPVFPAEVDVDFAAKLAVAAWLQGADPVRAVPRSERFYDKFDVRPRTMGG